MAELQKEATEELQELADANVDSTDSNVRYLGYAGRLRTALTAGSRYLAYTSDIGEAFRPVVRPIIVTGGYAVSWLYLIGDVSYETYKAHRQGPTPLDVESGFSENTRLGMVAVHRAVFQSVASMGLPALTIHTIVAQSSRLFRNTTNPRLKAWGPTVLGLSAVPALPYMFDHPVEHATDKVAEWAKAKYLERRRALGKGDKEL